MNIVFDMGLHHSARDKGNRPATALELLTLGLTISEICSWSPIEGSSETKGLLGLGGYTVPAETHTERGVGKL